MFVRQKSFRFHLQRLICAFFLVALSCLGWAQSDSTGAKGSEIWLLGVDGVIGPASADYLSRNVENAADKGAALVIIQMNTPGGLDESMRGIIQAILSSPTPVVVYVAPSGARAASAGTYILYAAHVAAMAPATNLGAATPVQIGGVPTPQGGQEGEENGQPARSDMERKILNDAVAYIGGLAELRGRNKEWAARAVREGVSLSAREALDDQVIDLIATDLDDLLQQLDGRTVTLESGERVLATENAKVVSVEPDWRSRFLAVITNPNVAYILMLIGIYGLIFEFSNPGLGGPGIIGAICLLLALYAFQVLPVSYVGLGLIIVGLGLMVAEAFSPTFGVMGVGGAIAFIMGSVMLMDTDLPAYQIALPIILALAVASVALLVFTLGMVYRSRRSKQVTGVETLIGDVGEVEYISQGRAFARLQGELWQVRSKDALEVGDQVMVHEVKDLVLKVEKIKVEED